MTQTDRRQELLDRAVAYMTEHGFGEVSLRQVSEAIGTSHRMLIHYFGSKEGLWAAIVGEVERQQRELFRQFQEDIQAPSGSVGDAIRAWWRHISDPTLWPAERLFFDVYAQALQSRAPAAALKDSLVDPWVELAAAGAEAVGMDPARARASARLGLATTRGLLLDLLATGDTSGVDAAMDEWIRLFEAGLATSQITGRSTS